MRFFLACAELRLRSFAMPELVRDVALHDSKVGMPFQQNGEIAFGSLGNAIVNPDFIGHVL